MYFDYFSCEKELNRVDSCANFKKASTLLLTSVVDSIYIDDQLHLSRNSPNASTDVGTSEWLDP